METYSWILWIFLGILFITAEMFTSGFVLLWFGIGAIAAVVVSFFGGGMVGQFLIFSLVSIALTIMSRTIFDNFFGNDEDHEIKTGIDTLPGKIGTVKKASEGALHAASVKVYGSEWKAFPFDEKTALKKGEKVEVVRVEGSSIYVRKTNVKGLPDWREDD